MDSTTSRAHGSNDDEHDEQHELDRINARDVIADLDRLASAVGEDRVVGAAIFLSARRSPPRATVEIPPDPTRKNRKRAGHDQEGPDHAE